MNFNKQKSVKYHKKTAASIMFRNLETELNSLTLTSVLEIRLGVDLNREDQLGKTLESRLTEWSKLSIIGDVVVGTKQHINAHIDIDNITVQVTEDNSIVQRLLRTRGTGH